MDELLADVRARLEEMGTEEGRRSAARFFKGQVACHGISSPDLKRYAAGLSRETKAWPVARRDRFCTGLWKGGELENGILVTYLYGRFSKNFGEREFSLFEGWLGRFANNWAHCDALSAVLFAACIANHPELAPRVLAWTGSGNRWKRRAAAAALVKSARAGRHTELALNVAERLRLDTDEMVQKGVGWLLKEVYPRRPVEAVEFLVSRPEPFPRLVLRYAAEKMSPVDRARVLGWDLRSPATQRSPAPRTRARR